MEEYTDRERVMDELIAKISALSHGDSEVVMGIVGIADRVGALCIKPHWYSREIPITTMFAPKGRRDLEELMGSLVILPSDDQQEVIRTVKVSREMAALIAHQTRMENLEEKLEAMINFGALEALEAEGESENIFALFMRMRLLFGADKSLGRVMLVALTAVKQSGDAAKEQEMRDEIIRVLDALGL